MTSHAYVLTQAVLAYAMRQGVDGAKLVGDKKIIGLAGEDVLALLVSAGHLEVARLLDILPCDIPYYSYLMSGHLLEMVEMLPMLPPSLAASLSSPRFSLTVAEASRFLLPSAPPLPRRSFHPRILSSSEPSGVVSSADHLQAWKALAKLKDYAAWKMDLTVSGVGLLRVKAAEDMHLMVLERVGPWEVSSGGVLACPLDTFRFTLAARKVSDDRRSGASPPATDVFEGMAPLSSVPFLGEVVSSPVYGWGMKAPFMETIDGFLSPVPTFLQPPLVLGGALVPEAPLAVAAKVRSIVPPSMLTALYEVTKRFPGSIDGASPIFVAAGGFAAHFVVAIPSSRFGDIDLYVVGFLTPVHAVEAILMVLEEAQVFDNVYTVSLKRLLTTSFALTASFDVREEHGADFVIHSTLDLQFVLRSYDTISSIIAFYDLDLCKVALPFIGSMDSVSLFVSRGQSDVALMTYSNFLTTRISSIRIQKAIYKGQGVVNLSMVGEGGEEEGTYDGACVILDLRRPAGWPPVQKGLLGMLESRQYGLLRIVLRSVFAINSSLPGDLFSYPSDGMAAYMQGMAAVFDKLGGV